MSVLAAWIQSELAAPQSVAALFAGLVFVACAIAALPLALFVVRAIAPRAERVPAGWGVRELAIVVASIFALFVSANLALHATDGTERLTDVRVQLVATAVVFALAGALVIALARSTTPRAYAALGLSAPHPLRAVAGACAAYVLCLPGLLGVGALWTVSLRALGVEDLEQGIARDIGRLTGDARWLAALLGVLVVPALEELLFRGFLQTALERFLPPLGALLLASATFALLHGAVASVPIFALSLILGGVLLRTRSLAACWAVHALHNGATLAFLWMAPQSWRQMTGDG